MSSKLKEPDREKESLWRKRECLYKRIQEGKKALTKLTPKNSLSRVKGIREQLLYSKVLTQELRLIFKGTLIQI